MSSLSDFYIDHENILGVSSSAPSSIYSTSTFSYGGFAESFQSFELNASNLLKGLADVDPADINQEMLDYSDYSIDNCFDC